MNHHNSYVFRYVFDYDKLKDAHEFCKKEAEKAVKEKKQIVIINNTHVKIWEFKHYLNLAKEYGYRVVIMEAKTPWAWDARLLAERSTHSVPFDLLEQKVIVTFHFLLTNLFSKCLLLAKIHK